MSSHTFIGIITALVEKWGIEHGCEHHRYLIEQCNHLYEELQVRPNFVFVKYVFCLHIGMDIPDCLRVHIGLDRAAFQGRQYPVPHLPIFLITFPYIHCQENKTFLHGGF
jgi:hypothetical protein